MLARSDVGKHELRRRVTVLDTVACGRRSNGVFLASRWAADSGGALWAVRI